MRIERVIIRGLRALDGRDDAWLGHDGKPHPAGCLRGINGSGKTTYLKALAELWQWFRRCTQHRTYADYKHLTRGSPGGGRRSTPQHRTYADYKHLTLAEADLVAALVTDLPGPRPRMWIAAGAADQLRTLPAGTDNPYSIAGDQITWDPAVLAAWDEDFARADLGVESPPPNIVFIEAEEKYVPQLRAVELRNPRPTASYQPVARYLPSARGASHLEPLMRTLFLARRERWDLLAGYIRELLPGVELLDRFDEGTQRPIFRLASGTLVDVNRLSAGQRSLLINLCMVLRWLAPGGIVLLDEPELHQHLSLMSGSLAVLDDLVTRRFAGQLLVASHAPEVWDFFRGAGAIIELGSEA